MHPKEQSLVKKSWKPDQNRPLNRHTIFVWTISPTCRQTKRDIKKNTNFRSYSVVDLPQTLHANRERRDNSKRCQLFFDPTNSFSCRSENADFWSLTHSVNLIQAGCSEQIKVVYAFDILKSCAACIGADKICHTPASSDYIFSGISCATYSVWFLRLSIANV